MISYETYQQEMRRNLLLMSRTANGVVDTSASADKAKYMLIQSGENAAKTVSANVENALRLVYEHRADNFENAEALKTFLLRIAQTVNAGVLTPGCLMRQGADSKIFRYVKIEFLPKVFDQFCASLYERINAEKYDAVEAACFSEYGINLTGHFFADGCGKTAMVTAAFLLMRQDHHLPDYISRDDYYRAMEHYPSSTGENYMDEATYREFLRYYRSVC